MQPWKDKLFQWKCYQGLAYLKYLIHRELIMDDVSQSAQMPTE